MKLSFLSQSIAIALNLFIFLPIKAQDVKGFNKPLYVPFEVNDKMGLMDTLGREVPVSSDCYRIQPMVNFSYYIVSESGDKGYSFWLMDPKTGKDMGLGKLQDNDPLYYHEGIPYHHVHKNNVSVIISPVNAKQYVFDKIYEVKYSGLYDPAGNLKKDYFITEDANGIKAIWRLEGEQLKKVLSHKDMKSVKPIYVSYKTEYGIDKAPMGFAVTPEVIVKKTQPAKKVVAKKNNKAPLTPPEPIKVEELDAYNLGGENALADIYDFELKKIASSKTDDEALKLVYGNEASLVPTAYVSMGGGLASSFSGDSKPLSTGLELQKILVKVGEGTYREVRYLVKTDIEPKVNLISQDSAQFRFVGSNDVKVLEIRFTMGTPEMKAYFDGAGSILPKDKLMIPRKYYLQRKDQNFIPYLIP